MASSSQSPQDPSNTVQPYRMHVSQKYLDLTRQKLELTRLPRNPRNAPRRGDWGLSKDDLEPLVDHWLEDYDWRAQETFYNDSLPQFRVPINGTRLHFVHKRSHSMTALPLLFVHGWPESFITASKIIDALCNPIATPPRGDLNVQAFNVVVPSTPGFGFSDPIPEAANNMQATAEVYDALMKGLGYDHYICHGTGWGFRICRILAMAHPDSCLAIHTANPDVPAPRFGISTIAWLKYRIAKLIFAVSRRSAYGYNPGDFGASGSSMGISVTQAPGLSPPLTPGVARPGVERPQTTAYALCDSPSGLLAYVLDAIRPPSVMPSRSPSSSPESLRPPTAGRSPVSPQSHGSRTPGAQSPGLSMPQTNLELSELSPWTPTALVNWAMLYWLPGPEVALRWLVNSQNLLPSLWASYSPVPLGITHFQEPASGYQSQSPPQWAEAYHRIAMLRRRDGAVRFPSWERPADIVMDIREFVDLLGLSAPPVTNGL